MNPEQLFLPMVDCHTGDVTDLDSQVAVDHIIAVGSRRMKGGLPVRYGDSVPNEVAPYLLPSLVGRRYSKFMTNGDFVCHIEDVRQGKFSPARVKPTNVSDRRKGFKS